MMHDVRPYMMFSVGQWLTVHESYNKRRSLESYININIVTINIEIASFFDISSYIPLSTWSAEEYDLPDFGCFLDVGHVFFQLQGIFELQKRYD